MLNQKRSKVWIIVNSVICLLLIAASAWVVLNRQFVIDQIAVWQFHSTPQLDALVDRAGMNNHGKFFFLASRPVLDGTQNFNNECARIESTTSILGCYSNNQIFIYDVTDKALDGVREVTATHETLHAIYNRLSTDEKDKIDVLLEAEYKKLQGNKDYADRMAFYARTEPGERDNELHSVVGTEIAKISPELETYYSKYFTNRQDVVALNKKYMSKFIDLKTKANALAAQINDLTSSITTRTNQYNSDAKKLDSDIRAFNLRAKNGDFTSQAQFDAERSVLATRSSELNDVRSSINSDISTYDKLLAEYNSLASESKKLYNSIDSTLAPAPSVPSS